MGKGNDLDRRIRMEQKADRLREQAAKTEDPEKRDRLLDAAAEYAGKSLGGTAAPRER